LGSGGGKRNFPQQFITASSSGQIEKHQQEKRREIGKRNERSESCGNGIRQRKREEEGQRRTVNSITNYVTPRENKVI